MATKREYIEFLAEQLAGADCVFKKMFGEYGVYCDGVLFGLVCDDRLLVKPTPAAEALLPGATREPPYPGAKPMLLVEDVDDAERLCELARRVSAELPPPAPRRKRS